MVHSVNRTATARASVRLLQDLFLSTVICQRLPQRGTSYSAFFERSRRPNLGCPFLAAPQAGDAGGEGSDGLVAISQANEFSTSLSSTRRRPPRVRNKALAYRCDGRRPTHGLYV